MRRILVSLLALTVAGPAFSQQQTLVKGSIESGGYGAPGVKLTWFNADPAVMVGGQGAWIINHSFALGGGGYGIATALYLNDSDDNPRDVLRLEGGYGGLLLEYYFQPQQVVHFAFGSLIGAGGMVIMEGRRTDYWDETLDESAFFVAEPMVGVALNVTTFFHMGLDAGYRFVVGSSLLGLKDSDLSAPSVMLTFRFGGF